MCTTLLPQIRGPDDPVVRGGEPGGTRNVLTWDIHSHGQLVFVILGGELDIATAPGLPGGWRRSPTPALTFSWTWPACSFVTAPL